MGARMAPNHPISGNGGGTPGRARAVTSRSGSNVCLMTSGGLCRARF
jgi:hypothetical protein